MSDKPQPKRITEERLTGVSLYDLQVIYMTQYAKLMQSVPDGSGQGRGLSMYRIWNPLQWADSGKHYLHPFFWSAIEQIQEPGQVVAQVLFNRLAKGTKLSRHVDGAPYRDRYHLVLISKSGSRYWQEDQGQVIMYEGNWYGPISYWLPHEAGNDLAGSSYISENERVHFVVDLEPANPRPPVEPQPSTST